MRRHMVTQKLSMLSRALWREAVLAWSCRRSSVRSVALPRKASACSWYALHELETYKVSVPDSGKAFASVDWSWPSGSRDYTPS